MFKGENLIIFKDIVDILVTITADALGLDLYIYQNNQGKIQVLKYSGGPISKAIYLKFTHNEFEPSWKSLWCHN